MRYRVVKRFQGQQRWHTPIINSEARAREELARIERDHLLMLERHLRDDPRGESSPVVQRLRQWTVELVEV